MPNSRLNYIRSAGFLYTSIPNRGICVYCGACSTCTDHFIPLSYTNRMLNTGIKSKKLVKLPSCISCNSIAGSEVFSTLGKKRRYIQRRLRQKYKKLLKTPCWEEKEFAEISDNLAAKIRSDLIQRKELLRRISWRNNIDHITARTADVLLGLPENGQNSVMKDVPSKQHTRDGKQSLIQQRKELKVITNSDKIFLKHIIAEFGIAEAIKIYQQTEEKEKL